MDGCLPLKYVDTVNPHSSILYRIWRITSVLNTKKDKIGRQSMHAKTFHTHYLKPSLNVPEALVCLLYHRSCEVSLPSFMLPAHRPRRRQPLSELALKEFLLLIGSRPKCLHSTAGEAPYCLDKLPNTQPGGCPITHPLASVCAITSFSILLLSQFRALI